MKLIKKLLLAFVPVLLYFALFVVFEPYNYFNLRDSTTDSDKVIYRVRNFVNNPTNAILLGDSRLAHLDMNLVNETSDKQFSNLAFGGASLKEVIDLFYFAVEQNPNIDTVYLQVSFYTLNKGYDKDRMANIETIVTNPLAYMLNFDYAVEMLNQIKLIGSGVDVGAPEHETATYTAADYQDENGNPLPYRRQLLQYYENIRSYCENYSLNEEQLTRLVDVASYCKEHNIRLVFVFPPMDISVLELGLKPNGILPDLQKAVDILKGTGARVLDYELTARPNFTEDQFFDGFHMDFERGLPKFTKLLFTEGEA